MKRGSRIDSLQAVRALAFLGIFISHCGYKVLSRLGPMSVSIFIILSGFLMAFSYHGTGRISNVSLKENIIFAYKKIKKLYPLHLLMMVAVLPLLIWENVHNPEHLFVVKTAIKSVIDALLLQSFFPTEGVYFSMNGVAWYLSVCVFLYFAFPWLLRRLEKDKSERRLLLECFILFVIQLVLAVAFSIGIKALHIDGGKLVTWFTYIFPPVRLIDFTIGCKLGLIFKMNYDKSSEDNEKTGVYTLAELGVVACLVLCVFLYANSILESAGWRQSALWTIPVCCLIYLFALKRGFISKTLTSSKWVLYIAELSAYAFLIHQVVIRYFHTAIYYTVGQDYMTFPLVPVACFIVTVVLTSLWKKKAA